MADLPTGVPILDHGITIPRNGYSVVLLDAKAVPAEQQRALDEIAALFGRRDQRTEREP